MKHLQEMFLGELKSDKKATLLQYAVLYKKYTELSIEEEINNGASKARADAMGHYYAIATLTDFIGSDKTIDRIVKFQESL